MLWHRAGMVMACLCIVTLCFIATAAEGLAGSAGGPTFVRSAALDGVWLGGGGISSSSVIIAEAQQALAPAAQSRQFRTLKEDWLVISQPAPPPIAPPPPPVQVPFGDRPVNLSVGVFIPYSRAFGSATWPNAKAGWSETLTLTFDDCGSPEQMEAVVNALGDTRQQGLFFITGQCRDRYPWLVDALVGAGHLVCNHTYSHQNLTKLTDSAIRAQIGAGVWANCPYFRPPYGAFDGRVAQIAREFGLTMMLWDVDSRDWAGASPQAMVATARARRGVVLFHLHGYATADAVRLLG